jgi:hypothetical protein
LDGEEIMTKKPEPEETDEELEERETEDQKDAEFILSATHQPRQGTFERFLVQSLAQPIIMTDDLKRIKALSLAAFMVEKPNREKLAIDYERVKVLNLVSTALLNPSVRKYQQGLEVVSIPWGFPQTEENFNKFILPWFSCGLRYWPDFITEHVETCKIWECGRCGQEFGRRKLPYSEKPKIPNKCPKCDNAIILRYSKADCSHKYTIRTIVKDPLWSFFFEICQYLSPEGYDLLKSNFIGWASEPAQELLGELTKMVDPNLYDQILGLYSRRGKRDYAQKVKETAEVSSANEDSLGPY